MSDFILLHKATNGEPVWFRASSIVGVTTDEGKTWLYVHDALYFIKETVSEVLDTIAAVERSNR